MKVIVLSGLPGSGKSTWAKKTVVEMGADNLGAILSADDFFTQPDGSWVFDPTKIGDAHADCLRKFIAHCQHQRMLEEVGIPLRLCIVDNPNLSIAEIAPYMAIAQAYGHEATVVRISCSPQQAFERQIHGVSFGTFLHMFATQRDLVLPPWWPSETVDATPELDF